MLIVQKYGGATLSDPEKIKSAASRIAHLKKNNVQVVAVVSAMGQTTDQLIALANKVSTNPSLRELDMLLSVGERMSMSLVSIALNDLGFDAISFTGSQAGILTDDAHLNAMIKDVKAFRVQEALEKNKVVILAGFQGVSPATKEITTLGRGGSDTSAVAMAAFLKADRCEILKDVSSIFSADPKIVTEAKRITALNYDQLLEMTYWGAKVLHYRSVELAKIKKVKLYVGPAVENKDLSLNFSLGTLINEDVMFESSRPIAVNSHSHVLQLSITAENISAGLDILLSDFQKNNIGVPQILNGFVQNNRIHFLVSGPVENLKTIINVQNKSKYSLENENLCSVSLTCTGSSLNETLHTVTKKLNSEKINVAYFIQSAMSLNYILESKFKDQTIKILHELI